MDISRRNGKRFYLNSIAAVLIGAFGVSAQSWAACTTKTGGPGGVTSAIAATANSQCTTDVSYVENATLGTTDATQVSVAGSGTSLSFSADSVNITSNSGSNGKAISLTNGGTLNFAGDLNVNLNGSTPSQNYGILLSSPGTLTIEKNLTMLGRVDNSFISALNGTVEVKGESIFRILDPSLRGAIIVTGMTGSGTNSQLFFRGKTTIENLSNSSTSIMMHGTSLVSFGDLDMSSFGAGGMDVSINEDAALTSSGTTVVDSGKNVILNVNTKLGSKGAIVLGESQSVIDQQLANRTRTLVNVGANASLTNIQSDAIGIRVNNSTTDISDISIKGTLDVRNGTAIQGKGTGVEYVSIDGGSVYGVISLDRGDDVLTANSGLIDGEIIMGRGSDTLILNQGIDITGLVKANGHDPMYVQTDAENNTLEANGLSFVGYTSLAGNSREGTNVANWDSVRLNNGAPLTLSDSLFESTLDRARQLVIDGSSSLIHQSGTAAAARSVYGSVENNGRIAMDNGAAGDTLTITGNYRGDGGQLVLNTVLHDDASPTDRLIVEGNTEAGTTSVLINQVGGSGALTQQGIEIVTVGGASDAVFKKMDNTRIVAGLYEYDIVKKGSNWYLTSELEPVTPPVTPPVDPGITPPPTVTPETINKYRPESGSYMANHMAANTLFLMRLHDRLGETQYTDVLTGEKRVTSMWMRHVGGHNRSRDSSGQLGTQSNRYVMQMGGDLAQWSSDGLDRWHLGAMVGYANQHSNTEAKYSPDRSRGSVEGYSAGLYGTWYANTQEKTGSYVDAWALYNWFDNEVSGDRLSTEKYKSRGVTASVESGYTFKLAERQADGAAFYLQPKAQVTWMGVRSKDHVEDDSKGRTRVSFDGSGNIQTRLGLRAFANGHSDIDKGKNRAFEPFIEANWLHNTKDFGVTMNGQHNGISGTKNIGELKLGVEGQMSTGLTLWGNVGQQVGSKGYSDTQAILGIKYSF